MRAAVFVVLCPFVSMTTLVDATDSSCVAVVASPKHMQTSARGLVDIQAGAKKRGQPISLQIF